MALTLTWHGGICDNDSKQEIIPPQDLLEPENDEIGVRNVALENEEADDEDNSDGRAVERSSNYKIDDILCHVFWNLVICHPVVWNWV